MPRWAGWGAGPAGAGATGGPSRIFLWAAFVFALGVAAALFRDGRIVAAVVALAGAGYFALRLFAGLGSRRGP